MSFITSVQDGQIEVSVTRDTSIEEISNEIDTYQPIEEDITVLDIQVDNAVITGDTRDLPYIPDLDVLSIEGPGLITGPTPFNYPLLTTIDIKDQQLSSVQEFLDIAPIDLSVLILSGNNIKQAVFDRPFELMYLDLSNNQLNYISGLNLLNNLEYLYLQNNQLGDVQIPNNIENVNVENNEISIPSLSKQVILPLKDKTMDEILIQLDDTTKVTNLDVSGGYGNISTGLLKLYNNLTSLSMNNGQFTGSAPDMSYFQQLTSLSITHHLIEDVRPLLSTLSRLGKLTRLNLSYNSLTEFIIPNNDIWIVDLNLSHNRLFRVRGLDRIGGLRFLNLSYNLLRSPPIRPIDTEVDISHNYIIGVFDE